MLSVSQKFKSSIHPILAKVPSPISCVDFDDLCFSFLYNETVHTRPIVNHWSLSTSAHSDARISSIFTLQVSCFIYLVCMVICTSHSFALTLQEVHRACCMIDVSSVYRLVKISSFHAMNSELTDHVAKGTLQ